MGAGHRLDVSHILEPTYVGFYSEVICRTPRPDLTVFTHSAIFLDFSHLTYLKNIRSRFYRLGTHK